MAKKNPKFLIQERDGQRPHVYAWTPVLAEKEDMRPITVKEAKRILKEQADEHAKKRKAALDPVEIDDDEEEEDFEHWTNESEDNDVIESQEGVDVDEGGKALVVTQEDILKEELEKVEQLAHSREIEEYILKKYKVDMIPMQTMEDMIGQAKDLLTTLGDAGKLYQVND